MSGPSGSDQLCGVTKQLGIVMYYRYSVVCVGVHVHMVDKLVTSVVPEVCCAGPRGSETSSEGICGYISVMATLKFHCFTVHFVSLSFIYTNVCTCF